MNSRIIIVYGKRDSIILMKPEILIPDQAHIITYYKRKGKKVLNACFFSSVHPVADINRALANCEVVIAVNTNSRYIESVGKVCATTAIEAYFNEVTEDVCHMQSGPHRQTIFVDPPGNQEIYGIGAIMHHFYKTHPKLIYKKVGIITDSELGLLKDINQRKIPFFRDMFLPENNTLFYATSDSGSAEFMPNKLVRLCDKASAIHLERYITDKFN